MLAVVLTLASSGAVPASSVSYGYLQELCANGWRRAGSPAAEQAASTIKSHLARFEYDSSIEPFTFPYYHVTDKSLTLNGKRYPVEEIMYSGSTPPEGITAEVVEPDGSWSNVKDKIAFIAFPNADPGWKNLSNTLKQDFADAVKAGAAGVIAEAPDRLYAASASKATWTAGAIPGLVVQGARDLIGTSPTMVLRSAIEPGTGRNVVAHKEGRSPETILVLAHYDAWFDGAADNGTGTAALLRAAELLKDDPLERSITFLAVDAEELGLIGSQAYVSAHGVSTIAGVVNLDMVSVKPSDVKEDAPVFQWRALMTTETPPLIASVEKSAAIEQVAGLPLPATAWEDGYGSFRTDYEWLYYQGVPGTWVISEAAYYHTTEDTISHVDATDLEQVSRMVVDVVRDMQTMLLPRVTHLDVNASTDGTEVRASVRLNGEPVSNATVTVTGYRDHAVVSSARVTPDAAGNYVAAIPGGDADQIKVHASWNTLDGETWLEAKGPQT